MNGSGDRLAATGILRILLRADAPIPEDMDWAATRALAQRDRVLLRLATRLAHATGAVPGPLDRAVTKARTRSAAILGLVARIGAVYDDHDVQHVFLKLAQHYPDMGRDVDLLVAGRSLSTDELLREHVPLHLGHRGLSSRIANTSAYALPGHDSVIDIHHGRLGRLGKYERYASHVLGRRCRAQLGPISCWIPSPEDQLLIQAVHHAQGRRTMRIADVYNTVVAAGHRELDWETVSVAADAAGLRLALNCHLDCVEQVHEQVLAESYLSARARSFFPPRRWGPVHFRSGAFRLPVIRATGRLYLHQLGSDLLAGDWAAAGRLCLYPTLVLPFAWRVLVGPLTR